MNFMKLAYAFLFVFLLPHLLHAAEVSRPNILFIAIDDLNDWIGCMKGHPQARTPNIDSLAERGICLRMLIVQHPYVWLRAQRCFVDDIRMKLASLAIGARLKANRLHEIFSCLYISPAPVTRLWEQARSTIPKTLSTSTNSSTLTNDGAHSHKIKFDTRQTIAIERQCASAARGSTGSWISRLGSTNQRSTK